MFNSALLKVSQQARGSGEHRPHGSIAIIKATKVYSGKE